MTCYSSLLDLAADDMLVGVDASGLAEQVDLGSLVTSSAPGQPEETQRHSCPPSSSRGSNHVESQPSTQPTTDEMNISAPPAGPYPDPPIDLSVPRTRGGRNVRRGLAGRNASLLTFSKKKGTLETLRRSRVVKDSSPILDTEILDLLGSSSTTPGSRAFHSGPSIDTSLQDRDATPIAAEQTSHDGIESHSPAEYEEQNRISSPSPNIE
jgi:hypothetical protein